MSSQISTDIMDAMRQAKGLEAGDTSLDGEILSLGSEKKFELYCQWNGLLGWNHTLLRVFRELFNGSLDE